MSGRLSDSDIDAPNTCVAKSALLYKDPGVSEREMSEEIMSRNTPEPAVGVAGSCDDKVTSVVGNIIQDISKMR